MVEEIRNKWCDDLEDLLQCPVCMCRPASSIYQCIQGHHICQTCKPQLSQCPTCAQRWSDSRNRLAEHLCTKLDEIKLSLIDPESEVNKLLIPDKVSVMSQTEGTFDVAPAAGPATGPAPKKLVDAHVAAYPCRIGACTNNRFYEPLLKHLVLDHAPQFSEIQSDGAVFNHTWPFEFTEQMIFDRAFLITDMGTFFLKLSSDIFGNFTGFILMAHNGFIAKHFTYQLEISCCSEHACSMYTGEVCSCRTPASVLREKCLHINRKEMQKMTDHDKRLNCTLLLGKRPVTEDSSEQSKKTGQKKKYPNKKRPQAPRTPAETRVNGTNSGPSNYRPTFNLQARPQTAPDGEATELRTREREDRPPPKRTVSMTNVGKCDPFK